MEHRPPSSTADEFTAALEWWRMAGLDQDFQDDATEWLTDKVVEEPVKPPVRKRVQKVEPPEIPEAVFGGDTAAWPENLSAFREWWLHEPTLDAGGTGPRVAPRGDAQPALMVIVAEPEADDSDILLSGTQGKMLEGFLRASGIASEQVYIASALTRQVPVPDWQQLARIGIGKVLEHHARLVDPARILVFGRNILPLIGHAPAQASAVFREFDHDDKIIPVMGSRGLADLQRSASGRARLWRNWLDWTHG